mmetsp:Transcript_32385/g.59542  ORF Transcript_32385/g.59542 Transcript_32385/m.59542 type:complete len:206 (+) Transcript_32385:663-1280(+)
MPFSFLRPFFLGCLGSFSSSGGRDFRFLSGNPQLDLGTSENMPSSIKDTTPVFLRLLFLLAAVFGKAFSLSGFMSGCPSELPNSDGNLALGGRSTSEDVGRRFLGDADSSTFSLKFSMAEVDTSGLELPARFRHACAAAKMSARSSFCCCAPGGSCEGGGGGGGRGATDFFPSSPAATRSRPASLRTAMRCRSCATRSASRSRSG